MSNDVIQAAPLDAYPKQDREFYAFWYSHMQGDLMQPPLAGISHSTARYIWDSAIATPKPEPLPRLCIGDSHMASLIESAIQGHASTRDAMRWLVRQLATKPEPLTWQPIETAPDNTDGIVVVRWLDGEGNEHHDLDYTEDGTWRHWHDRAEHVEMIGGHGFSYSPPYAQWLPLSPTGNHGITKGGSMSSEALSTLPEPFGYFRALPFGWEDCAATDDGAQALYDEDAIHTQAARIAELETEIADLHTTMMAAAVEIHEHWDAHCDAEGYGPANLMHRLERGIASQYGYDAKTLQRIKAERDQIRAEVERLRADAERLDHIEKHARCDPKMDGQHVWWPTNFNHALRGPTLRAALDAARTTHKDTE